MYKVLLGLLICAISAAEPVEISLTRVEGTEPFPKLLVPLGFGVLPLYAKVPADVKAPADLPAGFYYGAVKLGDSSFPFVISKGGDGKYSSLLFDMNANNDLNDDQPRNAENILFDGDEYASKWEMNLKYKIAGKEYDYKASLLFMPWQQIPEPQPSGQVSLLSWRNSNYYAGEFSIGRHAYAVRLLDQDADGVYGEKAEPVTDGKRAGFSGDRLFLAPSPIERPVSSWYWSDYISIKETLYQVDLRFAESKLVLTPVETPLEKIILPQETERLQIWNTTSKQMLSYLKVSEHISVPAGYYTLVKYQLAREEKGQPWFLEAVAPKKTALFAPGAGSLIYGEPYQPVVSIPQDSLEMYAQDPSSLMLDLKLTGTGGETVTSLQRYIHPTMAANYEVPPGMSQKDPNLPAEPLYRIVSADGEVVSQGNFEYG